MSPTSDHDLLLSISADLKNALRDQADIKARFAKHEAEDRESFDKINRVVWMGLGALALLQVILSYRVVVK